MGPQHPSTHGVLRLILEIEGETIIEARCGIGYLHTGIEKNLEFRNWTQGVTFVTRMDYLSPFFNETAYCLGVEKLLDVTDDDPRARHGDPGDADGAQPDLQPPGRAGHRRDGTRRDDGDVLRLPGTRTDPLGVRDHHRPADEPRLHPARRSRRRPARRRRSVSSGVCSELLPKRSATWRTCSTRTTSGRPAPRASATWISPGAWRSASPARCCAPPGLPHDLRKSQPYCGYENYEFDVITDRRLRLLRPLPDPGRGDAGVAQDRRAVRRPAGTLAAPVMITTRSSPGPPT